MALLTSSLDKILDLDRDTYSFLNEPKSIVDKPRVSYSVAKRVFDIVVAGMVMVSILVWLIPLIGILVKISSPGPAFFINGRTGKNGRLYPELNFRTTYYENSKYHTEFSLNDRRLTPIGRFLRKSDLEQMPQFLNVLAGHMSIVGPRPHPLGVDAKYWDTLPDYYKRYTVAPGITGLAQVRGLKGYQHPLSIIHEMRYDLLYIKKRSLRLDIQMCLETVLIAIRGDKKAW